MTSDRLRQAGKGGFFSAAELHPNVDVDSFIRPQSREKAVLAAHLLGVYWTRRDRAEGRLWRFATVYCGSAVVVQSFGSGPFV
jgi:hypothetical protein